MEQLHSFLFEIGTEELPATELLDLSQRMVESVRTILGQAKLGFNHLQAFATPRRLAVVLTGLEPKQLDAFMVHRGPAVKAAFNADGQPTKAALGFASTHNVAVAALSRVDGKKGEHLAYEEFIAGRCAQEVLPELIENTINALAQGKSMRAGDRLERFLRPIRWLTALLDEQLIECEVQGLQTGRLTYGHRIHAPKPIELLQALEYEPRLQTKGFVIPDFKARRQAILDQLDTLTASRQLVANPSEALLDEITGLVEWPVTLCGHFNEQFLNIPTECLVSTMEQHQRYIALYSHNGNLSHQFAFVANLESQAPDRVISGNERVIRPRFADAQFFFEHDQKQDLLEQRERLHSVVFQQQLGSVFDKTQRLVPICQAFAAELNVEKEFAALAAQLSKVDLVSNMVGEFPELQGIMGQYYARAQGLPEPVAQALAEQYLPQGQGDELPITPLGIALSLADKFDSLAGFFGIGYEPSGDRDPYALRRMALGIVRICIELELDIDVYQYVKLALEGFEQSDDLTLAKSISDFIMLRMPTLYRDLDMDTQMIRAVEGIPCYRPLDYHRRILAVRAFYRTPSAIALAEVYKRATNILRKNKVQLNQIHEITPESLTESAERTLFNELDRVRPLAQEAIQAQDYKYVLDLGAQLQPQIAKFFETVKVMSEDPNEQRNRLELLARVQRLLAKVADLAVLA